MVLLGSSPFYNYWDVCVGSNVWGVHKTNIILKKDKYPNLNSYSDIGKISLKE